LLVDLAVPASTIKNTSKERERQIGYDTANEYADFVIGQLVSPSFAVTRARSGALGEKYAASPRFFMSLMF